MTTRLLVLHGPDLARLGQGSLASLPNLDALDAALDFAASAAGIELRCARGGEAELVRALEGAVGWATQVLVSPGALAPTAWLLRAALAFHALPYGEVFVEEMPDSDEHRRRSVLEAGALVRRRAPISVAYAEGASRLLGIRFAAVPPGIAAKAAGMAGPVPSVLNPPAAARPREEPVRPPATPTLPPPPVPPPSAKRELGRAPKKFRLDAVPPPAASSASSTGTKLPPTTKTLGRREKTAPSDGSSSSSRNVTRAQVRQHIGDRLSGRSTAAQLASWGREQWLSVERGGPVEAGQRELLQETLQSLALSTMPGTLLSEPELLDLMARMG